MSHITVTSATTGLRKVEYRPSYTYTCSNGDPYPVPALVSVQFNGGDIRMALRIEDAEALLYALGVAMVEHAVALKDSPSDPKLVA
ncbi:hypothetical protein ACFXG4_10025 [Nocardia sp. NPDC059246]|uniref:hypothetical protein n=1 Tax=unclassified Nocardia TaxID=2637762 RepID=UPI0036B9D760